MKKKNETIGYFGNPPNESPTPKSWRMTQPLLVPNTMTSLPAAIQVITPRPLAAYLSSRSTENTCLLDSILFLSDSEPIELTGWTIAVNKQNHYPILCYRSRFRIQLRLLWASSFFLFLRFLSDWDRFICRDWK